MVDIFIFLLRGSEFKISVGQVGFFYKNYLASKNKQNCVYLVHTSLYTNVQKSFIVFVNHIGEKIFT